MSKWLTGDKTIPRSLILCTEWSAVLMLIAGDTLKIMTLLKFGAERQ